ncbi:type II toxin-antitoxin system HicA family toxin [Microseira sp. BLCC-F43]|jgi:predicted RNA binding protein YcfA (HicA-like mRNA interferase family)|uniref:type II toxin-antitoxin system HicA family toxin n=1 Tax=Microseira sp. BLCC-F43 TaxID=3153602 RepID=UPI0035B91161
MPKKIRELKKLLLKAGFTYRQGKGSHQVWNHSQLIQPIVIARQDGEDAPMYLEKQVNAALKQLEQMEDL